jgi:hypothetical protein
MKLTKAQNIVYERAKYEPIVGLPDGSYAFKSSQSVHKKTFNNLIKKGALQANGDGLFAGFDQTWSSV